MLKKISMHLLLLVFFTVISRVGFAQNDKGSGNDLSVNKSFPAFRLDEVSYYRKDRIGNEDLSGKWTVFYFWNAWCGTCITALPAVDSIYNETKDSVQFFLVGYTGSRYMKEPDYNRIHLLYEKLRARVNLSIPIAYDSALFSRFDFAGGSYVVVTDPKGTVKAITTKVTREILDALRTGKPVKIKPAKRARELTAE